MASSEGELKIAVAGVGGAGCNTINRLARFGISNAKLIAFNTDKKHLGLVHESAERLLLGPSVTKGLGAGGFPEIAEKAALSSKAKIESLVSDCDLLFLTSGMGGGTGTGASPVIAEIAKDQGAVVFGFVTYPFNIEKARLKKAEAGIDKLLEFVDSLVIIDNNRLVDYAPNLQIEKAFELADEITSKAIGGISQTITEPSLINIDYADVKAVVTHGGVSMIAVGRGAGIDRLDLVVKSTLRNKLLDVDHEGSEGVLVHLTGGTDLTLGDANQAGELLTEKVNPNANVIYGARLEPGMEGAIEAIAIFTGLQSKYNLGKRKPIEKIEF
jgi:cell division protein FtsZ